MAPATGVAGRERGLKRQKCEGRGQPQCRRERRGVGSRPGARAEGEGWDLAAWLRSAAVAARLGSASAADRTTVRAPSIHLLPRHLSAARGRTARAHASAPASSPSAATAASYTRMGSWHAPRVVAPTRCMLVATAVTAASGQHQRPLRHAGCGVLHNSPTPTSPLAQ